MRYFIDMDGVLCVWKYADSEEALYGEGFFLSMNPNQEVLRAINAMVKQGLPVFTLSKYIEDSKYALLEKNLWLNKYLPALPEERRIFVPHLDDKSAYVPGGIQKDDVLLDDYSDNLRQWEAAGGIGVKLMNDINGTKGTWCGIRVGINCSDIKILLTSFLDIGISNG